MVIRVRKVLRNALRTLHHQRNRLDEQIRQLEAALGQRDTTGAVKPRRRMKASTRKILSTKMKERWADQRRALERKKKAG